MAQQPYEFQAAGEYTLLRTPDGSMEIQARQAPYPDCPTSRSRRLSPGRSPVIGLPCTPIRTRQYSLMLDGAALDPATAGTVDLGGGAALTALPDGIEVAYGDGTISTVLFHGNGFAQALDIQIAPSDALKRRGTGSAGSNRRRLGAARRSLTERSCRCRRCAPRSSRSATSSWRRPGTSTDQTSLFDYNPVRRRPPSTRQTFPTRTLPSQSMSWSRTRIPPRSRTPTTHASAPPGQPEDLQHCIFDVLATKDPNYAQFYALLTQFLANGPTALGGGGPIVEVTVPPPPTPSSNLPAGFVQVTTDVSQIKGATMAADGVLYASVLKPDGTAALVSVDATRGTPGPSITTAGSGGVFLLDGSLWLAQDDPTGGDKCTLERFDPATLAEQATIPVVCDIAGVQAVPVADGVWLLDRSTADGDGHGGMIRHIDPATNTVDRSVEVPFVNGFLGSSPTTVIFGSSDEGSGWYRLTAGRDLVHADDHSRPHVRALRPGRGPLVPTGPGLPPSRKPTSTRAPPPRTRPLRSTARSSARTTRPSTSICPAPTLTSWCATRRRLGAQPSPFRRDADHAEWRSGPGLLRQRSAGHRQPDGGQAWLVQRPARRRHNLRNRAGRQHSLTAVRWPAVQHDFRYPIRRRAAQSQ